MKIEIDTKQDTKEELVHLANMLHALSGHEGSRAYPTRLEKKVAKVKNIFDDPAPSMPAINEPAEPTPSIGLFDMFSQPVINEPIQPKEEDDSYSLYQDDTLETY